MKIRFAHNPPHAGQHKQEDRCYIEFQIKDDPILFGAFGNDLGVKVAWLDNKIWIVNNGEVTNHIGQHDKKEGGFRRLALSPQNLPAMVSFPDCGRTEWYDADDVGTHHIVVSLPAPELIKPSRKTHRMTKAERAAAKAPAPFKAPAASSPDLTAKDMADTIYGWFRSNALGFEKFSAMIEILGRK